MKSADATSRGDTRSDADRRTRQRILVIDDDPGIRESFECALRDHCEVLTAASATEALTLLRERAPDLVVLDYCLPDGPGSHILQTIKREWPAVPVMVITAYGSETLCAQLFGLGARAYFPKPYDFDVLLGTVKRLLALPKDGSRQNALATAPSAEVPRACRDLHPGIQRALGWIQTHYTEPVSLEQAAKEAAISPFHFCRTFKIVVGMGLREYLTRLRVEKAKEILRASDREATEVAFMVGFSNLSCFYTAFRRITGESPCAWRRSARETPPRNFS